MHDLSFGREKSPESTALFYVGKGSGLFYATRRTRTFSLHGSTVDPAYCHSLVGPNFPGIGTATPCQLPPYSTVEQNIMHHGWM